MKKRTTPAKLFKNKFCGRSDCTLGFVHWHDARLPGVVHVPPPPVTRIEGKSADAIIVDDPHAPADEVASVFTNEADAMADKIAAAVKALPCSDDPDADRFKGKSPVEIELIVFREHMDKALKNLSADFERLPSENILNASIDSFLNITKEHGTKILGALQAVAQRGLQIDGNIAQLDKALTEQHMALVERLNEFHKTLDECWQFWKQDQQQPAWAHDFGTWILAQIHSEADFKMLRSDVGLVNENITTLTGSIVERYNLANKRMMELVVETNALSLKVRRFPGFWTIMAASAAGGASLLAFIIGIFVIAANL